jgi:molecular chaperone GrpE
MELIASLDDVDLGLRALDEAALASPAGEGLRALQARLEQAIAKLGAEHYPALGMTFDPHLHQAFSAVEMDGAGRDQIVDELRRGYRYEGRIIRYSLVQVANPRR